VTHFAVMLPFITRPYLWSHLHTVCCSLSAVTLSFNIIELNGLERIRKKEITV